MTTVRRGKRGLSGPAAKLDADEASLFLPRLSGRAPPSPLQPPRDLPQLPLQVLGKHARDRLRPKLPPRLDIQRRELPLQSLQLRHRHGLEEGDFDPYRFGLGGEDEEGRAGEGGEGLAGEESRDEKGGRRVEEGEVGGGGGLGLRDGGKKRVS